MKIILTNSETNEQKTATIRELDGNKWFFIEDNESSIPFCKLSERPGNISISYDFNNEIADMTIRLKQARLEKGLSTYDMERLYGIPRQTLMKVESFKVVPRIDTIMQLAFILGVSTEKLTKPFPTIR